MNLESKITAYMVDLGLIPYQDLLSLQDKIVQLRKSNVIDIDIILSAQHPPEVNFGSANGYNEFSEAFLNEVANLKGKDYNEMDIIEVLSKKGLNFSKTKRGGGATVLAPGQLVYYPIVDPRRITKKDFDVFAYKKVLDTIMYEVLKSFKITNINIASGYSSSGRERRDVWYVKNGKSYKIGSKGIYFAKDLAYHGFVLYIYKSGVDPFWIVKPCGYDHEEVGIISAEQVLGRKLNHDEVNQKVKSVIKKYFLYDKIKELNKDELFKFLSYHQELTDAKTKYG